MQRLSTERSCTDIPCLVFFLVVLGSFLGFGSYTSYTSYAAYSGGSAAPSYLAAAQSELLQRSLTYIVAMMSLSAATSLLLIWTLRCWTYGACIIMAAVMFVVLFALAIINFIRGDLTAGIVVSVVILILTLFICCFKNELERMVKVMRTVGVFTLARPCFMVIPLAMALLCIALGVVWIMSYYSCMQLTTAGLFTAASFSGFSVFWIFCGFFLTLFMVYAMVFLVAGETALWFYKSELRPVTTPFKWLVLHHLGTIAIAAVISTFVKVFVLLLSMANHRRRVKGMATFVVACVLCLLSCVLHQLEFYTKILNNFSVIMCALTGKRFFEAATFSAQFVMENLGAIGVFNIASWFLRVAGGLTCASIPTVISYFLFKGLGFAAELVTAGSIFVFAASLMVGLVLLEGYIEAMNAMFLFYAFEAEMGRFGRALGDIVDDRMKLELMYGDAFEDNFTRIGTSGPSKSKLQNIDNPRLARAEPAVADASSSETDSAADREVEQCEPIVYHIMEAQKSPRESIEVQEQYSYGRQQSITGTATASPTPLTLQNFSSVSAGANMIMGSCGPINSQFVDAIKDKPKERDSVEGVVIAIPALEAYKEDRDPVKICYEFSMNITKSTKSIK